MERFDLGFAWNWPYDSDFCNILHHACHCQDIRIYSIHPDNLNGTLEALVSNQLYFQALLDRASDMDRSYDPLVLWARQQNVLRINRYRLARRAANKSTMHQLLSQNGLDTPATVLLPPYVQEPRLMAMDIQSLGSPLVIKPAHGGAGRGVHLDIRDRDAIQRSRQEFPLDQYLVQSIIDPVMIEGKPAWFRSIYCAGDVFLCWWGPETHCYIPLSEADEQRFGLHPLRSICHQIAAISQIELFSTEIALTRDGRFVVIDYLNDPIDLRLQSRVPEGVPDWIVETIAHKVVQFTIDQIVRPCPQTIIQLNSFSAKIPA
jgi:hypothetical protein